jgi:hypothetical protein
MNKTKTVKIATLNTRSILGAQKKTAKQTALHISKIKKLGFRHIVSAGYICLPFKFHSHRFGYYSITTPISKL